MTWQSLLWLVALSLYGLNLLVGLAAQLRWAHFGLTHHVLYFVVFASALALTVCVFHPWLLLTVAALAYMPRSQPGTWKHPTAAMVGAAGYGLALFAYLTA